MASIFTKIVNGEIPCYKIAETDEFLAFLDVNPNSKGHTLCIPKLEVDKIFDLDENTYNGLMAFSRKVAIAIKKVIPCKRIGMTVIGLEVPHAHVHLIPLHTMEDARFIQKTKMTSEELNDTAKAIKAQFDLDKSN
ncbi:HIT family protein [Confluentibacter flavum]|uniref:HIT family protein n=1 Tax=Confluentibacter flavum TaxID=1909700 RepID=A0A2N3HIL2_9FLAO|nr:HIT family protein [Confluentibacter flavum]PKQ44658.1 HIT family protein [Confluentibacter flavum]